MISAYCLAVALAAACTKSWPNTSRPFDDIVDYLSATPQAIGNQSRRDTVCRFSRGSIRCDRGTHGSDKGAPIRRRTGRTAPAAPDDPAGPELATPLIELEVRRSC